MKLPPLDKRALIHTIKWSPKKINMTDADNVSYTIDKVRLWENITLTFHQKQIQETNIGNWRLWWDAKLSGKMPDGSNPKFSIGDTIEFMPNSPIYPQKTQILNIIPMYDVDGSIHHLELVLL